MVGISPPSQGLNERSVQSRASPLGRRYSSRPSRSRGPRELSFDVRGVLTEYSVMRFRTPLRLSRLRRMARGAGGSRDTGGSISPPGASQEVDAGAGGAGLH